MKELSIEEKAKRYDELFVKAKQIYNKENDVLIIHTIEDFFPELKESEDERIRKELLAWFKRYKEQDTCGSETFNGIPTDNILAWLEKQGKHKPAWSEEDDNCLSTIIAEFSKCAGKSVSKDEWMRCNDFLNSLKDKVQPQSRHEWSKEDESNFQNIDSVLFYDKGLPEDTCMRLRNWLESLRPQNVWNPSKEQMLAINVAINVLGKGTLNGKQLIELQEQLKRLKRE